MRFISIGGNAKSIRDRQAKTFQAARPAAFAPTMDWSESVMPSKGIINLLCFIFDGTHYSN